MALKPEEEGPLSELEWQRLRSLSSTPKVESEKKLQLENLVSSVIQDMTKRKSNRPDDDQ